MKWRDCKTPFNPPSIKLYGRRNGWSLWVLSRHDAWGQISGYSFSAQNHSREFHSQHYGTFRQAREAAEQFAASGEL